MSDAPTPRHLRRAFANRTECDEEDDRVFAEGPADCTCQACLDAYEKRASEWHGELLDHLHGRDRSKRDTDLDPPDPIEDADTDRKERPR